MGALIAGLVALAGGLVVVAVALLAWQRRLPRNHFAGVRTAATLRSDTAFRDANRAAAPLTLGGGLLLAASGAVSTVLGERSAHIVITAGAGVAVLVILAGAVLGQRAARQSEQGGAG